MTILTDKEIKRQMSDGKLIIEGDEQQVGPASYELRLGNIYYDLTEDDKRIEV